MPVNRQTYDEVALCWRTQCFQGVQIILVQRLNSKIVLVLSTQREIGDDIQKSAFREASFILLPQEHRRQVRG